MKETNEELTVKAFPLLMWSFVLGSFVLGFFVVKFYIESVGGVLMVAKLFQGSLTDVLTTLGATTFLPLLGLGLFHFSPLVITKFNRRTRIVTQQTFSLFGRKTRQIGYDFLKGGVRVDSEEDEGTTHYSLYFEVESGEKINLSNELSWFEGRTFDVAVKANEYLQNLIKK